MNRKRILIVDDEVGFTQLLQLNLNWTGRYSVRAVNDASAALPAARDFHPDLILLDVMMPGLDGGEVASQLHKNGATRDIPILFITAAVQKDEIDSHRGVIGGLRFIAKPVDIDDLIARIDQQLESQLPGVLDGQAVCLNLTTP